MPKKKLIRYRFRSIPPYYYTAQWRKLRKIVLVRDNRTCQYCGSSAYQADHIIPRGRGGLDVLANLVASCATCNRIGGGRLFKSFANKKKFILEKRKVISSVNKKKRS